LAVKGKNPLQLDFTFIGQKRPPLTSIWTNKKIGNVSHQLRGKIMSEIYQMRSTSWLAQRLGLSVTTIERLRAQGSLDLPPCHTIGKSKRYDEQAVEQWIRERNLARAPSHPQEKRAATPSASRPSASAEREDHGNN
jgi:predicted DNA-binding transcriptional regulator AlpA